jgi:hypothetical protein
MASEGTQHHARAHFSTPEVESARYAAAQRLGVLIEQREELVKDVARVEVEMAECEAKIRSFD